MKKFLNQPESFVDEMLEGIYAAHPRDVRKVGDDPRCLVTARPVAGKVGIATGGGSGHLPLFLGYVGPGLLDGCAVGGVFQSPSAEQMLEVTKAIHQGAGVLYIYGNYSGDIINFDMAAEMAGMDGVRVLSLVGNDDVASSPKGGEAKRRGVAGIFFVYKAAGAAAAAGLPLEEVLRVAEKARANVRTMGVALTPCIVPEVGHASFSLGEKEMEIGMGIHGEPGIRRGALLPADAVVDEMVAPILGDLPFEKGDEVAVLVNGLGATPKEELYVLYRRVHQVLAQKGIAVFHVWAGEFATSMEMAGASISLLKLDAELKRYLAAPARTPFFEQGAIEVWRRAAMERLGSRDVVALLAHVSAAMAEQRDALIALDGKVGDSDLGLTMTKGFAAAAAALQAAPAGEGPGKLLARAGMALARAAPSTMGTLMATGFMRGGKAVEAAAELGTPELLAFWEAFLNGILERGKAKPGDKTVVDALVPAVEALRAAQGAALPAALGEAARGAAAGVEATKGMVAQHGKAACFGEKTLGLPDAGATAAQAVIEAMRGFVDAA